MWMEETLRETLWSGFWARPFVTHGLVPWVHLLVLVLLKVKETGRRERKGRSKGRRGGGIEKEEISKTEGWLVWCFWGATVKGRLKRSGHGGLVRRGRTTDGTRWGDEGSGRGRGTQVLGRAVAGQIWRWHNSDVVFKLVYDGHVLKIIRHIHWQ